MKVARSNLLGEYVDASQVEHADTHGFQIVCPCCDESVFKVARPLPAGGLSQFFSHRQASPHQIAECEMRVSGIRGEDRVARNAEARGQSLALFQAHLRDALGLDAWCYGHFGAPKVHERLSKFLVLQTCFQAIRADQIRLGIEDIFADEVVQMKDGLREMGVEVVTTFGQSLQEGVAKDMMRHLLTPQGRANHAWLFRHTLNRIYLSHKLHGARKELGYVRDEAYPELFRLNMEALFTKNPRLAKNAYQKVIYETIRTRQHDMFYRTVTANMILDLLRIPYAEMLANHRAGRPKLDGIKPRMKPDASMGIPLPVDDFEGPAVLRL